MPHFQPFHVRQRGIPCLLLCHAAQHAKIHELVEHFALHIDAAFLGHIAEPHVLPHDRAAVPFGAAGVAFHNAEDDADRGRLAGAVGADKPEHAAVLHRKAEIVHRRLFPEGFGDMLHMQRHCRPPLSAPPRPHRRRARRSPLPSARAIRPRRCRKAGRRRARVRCGYSRKNSGFHCNTRRPTA